MAKFIYLYRGPATPMEDISPEVGEQLQKAWTDWGNKVGGSLVDFGSPFGSRVAVSDDGSEVAPSEQNGYTIVEAADLAAARGLVEGHPFLTEGKGRFAIDIYELVPM
ncbi:hypothetical protein [Oryzihumus sp.]|jgi:hypothetical protein|uniref:hypothetical protein n=1 Tax=Oryzihumus sp. TaxID=1968903 RepID=UPI002EDAAC2A